MTDGKNYPLGYSADEERRLAQQAEQVGEFTEYVFRSAGIRPGMQVLDVGSGVGDVALLAARMVGSEGAVLGVERAASSVGTAKRRAADLGLRNVSFVESDLASFGTERQFDAIVGRFVLSYVPDRTEVLRKLARNLRSGGIVGFVELDMTQIAQVPPSDLFLQARRWLLGAFAAGGTELEMGSKLHATFLHAGLPAPQMTAVQPVAGGPAQEYEGFVLGLRSLLPTIERHGIATAGEIDLDTLAERLCADATANDRVVFLSRIVGAWARLD